MNELDRKILGEHASLLARLEERTRNNYHLSEKIEQHMAVQNGLIMENIRGIQRNTVWRKVIVGIGSAIIAWFIKGEL